MRRWKKAMQKEQVTLKFGGPSHQIDIDTFTSVVLSYSQIVSACAKQEGIEEPLDFYITANEPGSFEVVLSIDLPSIAGLLATVFTISNLSDVLSLAASVLSFRKELAGKKKIESVTPDGSGNVIINVDGDNITINQNVYETALNRQEVVKATDSLFKSLDKNKSVTSFSVSKDGEQAFTADQDQFKSIANGPITPLEETMTVTEDVVLRVVGPYLGEDIPHHKWKFARGNTEFGAYIEDKVFLEKIIEDHTGFAVGTYIKAKLETVVNWDGVKGAYDPKKTAIVEVYDVIPPEQSKTEPLF